MEIIWGPLQCLQSLGQHQTHSRFLVTKESQKNSSQVQALSILSKARVLSGYCPLGWVAAVGTTSGARPCWVAVYLSAQGCLLGVLEAMK